MPHTRAAPGPATMGRGHWMASPWNEVESSRPVSLCCRVHALLQALHAVASTRPVPTAACLWPAASSHAPSGNPLPTIPPRPTGAPLLTLSVPHPTSQHLLQVLLLTSRCAVSTAPNVALITPMLPTREASSAYALSPAHLWCRGGKRSWQQGFGAGVGVQGWPAGCADCMILTPHSRMPPACYRGCLVQMAAAQGWQTKRASGGRRANLAHNNRNPVPSRSHEPVTAAGCHVLGKSEHWDALSGEGRVWLQSSETGR